MSSDVTRADVAAVVEGWLNAVEPGRTPTSVFVDGIMELVSGSDPAVYVVRESDLDAINVKRVPRPDGSYRWDSCNGTGSAVPDGDRAEDDARLMVETRAEGLVASLAVARAIESGPEDLDPEASLARRIEIIATRAMAKAAAEIAAVTGAVVDPADLLPEDPSWYTDIAVVALSDGHKGQSS